MQVCMLASMQECTNTSMQLCKYVCKYQNTDTITDYTDYRSSPITVQLKLHVNEVPII